MKTSFALCALSLAAMAGCTPAAFAPLAPSPVDSAARRPLAPGQRVRVTAPSAGIHKEVATVEAISADTLVLERRWAGQPLRTAVVRDSVQTLEISRGQQRYTLLGATLGAILGLGAGAIADRSCERSSGWIVICPFRLVGALLGAGFGAFAGAAKATDQWEPVPPGRIRARLTPFLADRLGLSASLRF